MRAGAGIRLEEVREARTEAMASINQNAYTSALPNFRNLGILLRILVIVNAAAIAAAIVKAPTLPEAWRELVGISAVVQPLLIVNLLALVLASGYLQRLPYRAGVLCVFCGTLVLSLVVLVAMYGGARDAPISFVRAEVLVALTT